MKINGYQNSFCSEKKVDVVVVFVVQMYKSQILKFKPLFTFQSRNAVILKSEIYSKSNTLEREFIIQSFKLQTTWLTYRKKRIEKNNVNS